MALEGLPHLGRADGLAWPAELRGATRQESLALLRRWLERRIGAGAALVDVCSPILFIWAGPSRGPDGHDRWSYTGFAPRFLQRAFSPSGFSGMRAPGKSVELYAVTLFGDASRDPAGPSSSPRASAGALGAAMDTVLGVLAIAAAGDRLCYTRTFETDFSMPVPLGMPLLLRVVSTHGSGSTDLVVGQIEDANGRVLHESRGQFFVSELSMTQTQVMNGTLSTVQQQASQASQPRTGQVHLQRAELESTDLEPLAPPVRFALPQPADALARHEAWQELVRSTRDQWPRALPCRGRREGHKYCDFSGAAARMSMQSWFDAASSTLLAAVFFSPLTGGPPGRAHGGSIIVALEEAAHRLGVCLAPSTVAAVCRSLRVEFPRAVWLDSVALIVMQLESRRGRDATLKAELHTVKARSNLWLAAERVVACRAVVVVDLENSFL
jgi:hypothetical protein